ncbi:hypothetical protein ACYULU_01615 [Breznakiellaceae bacterium SP9]
MWYTYELSNSLHKLLEDDSSAAQVSTWTNHEQFFEELCSEKGVRFKDFSSRLLTLEEVKKESEYMYRHFDVDTKIYRLGRTGAQDTYYVLISLAAESDNSRIEMTMCFDRANWSDTFKREEVPCRIEQFIERFDDLKAAYNKRLMQLIEREKQREKREKIHEMTTKSLELWLDSICQTLTVPYCINKGKTRYILSLLLNNKTQMDFQIRLTNFQETMPYLLDTIAMYMRAQEESPLRVHITNPSTSYDWIRRKSTK